MLATAMTNRGPMNTGGATPMQNPRNAPGFKQANQAGMQQRLSALTPSQMQAHQQYSAANQQQQQAAPMQMQAGNTNASLAAAAYNQQQSGMMQAQNAFNRQGGMAAVGGPANGQMLQMPATPFAQQAIPAWGGGSAQQQAMNAQMGVFQQPQLQSANAQNAQLAYNTNAQAQQQAMNAQMGMAAMQNPYGMTMGGGGFNERGSAGTPIGMHLSQLQAPYTSQPMAYGGRAVPASAYMF